MSAIAETTASSLQLFGASERQFISNISNYFGNQTKIAGIVYDYLEEVASANIEGDKVANLKQLTFIPNLQNVTLDYYMKSEPDIKSLTECSRLKSLTLSYLSKLSDQHFAMIARFPSLEFLSITSSCSSLTEQAIGHLSNSTSLQILEIDALFITKHLKLAVRKIIPVHPDDQKLVEEGPDGTSLAAAAIKYEKLQIVDHKYAAVAERIRRYIDFVILLGLNQIPKLKKIRLYGILGRQELALIRSKLPNIQVESNHFDGGYNG